ncbi:MAG: hypothetical protein V7638_1892 [Acidobacteriota bacterium]|jgi:hypothetical protein
MPEHLKIQFQITLADWLEFKRREQTAFRLWLLHLADVLWVPMLVLLAVSILLVFSTSLPAWLPIPILVLVAASHVYRLLPANSATRKAEREWKRELADVDCTVELSDNGFQYIAGSSTYNATWAEVSSVFQSEHLLIFCDDEIAYALLIPKRSFTSEKQLQEFREIAYQKTVSEKSGEVA